MKSKIQQANKRRRLSKKAVLEALMRSGGFIGVAAQMLGCNRKTVTRFLNKNPDVREAAKDVEEELLDLAETKLIQNIRAGKSTDIQFFLRTKGKHRGYTYQIEHAGPGGGPIPVENSNPEPDFDSMTNEQLKAYIAWQESLQPKLH